jgi:integrase
LLTTWQAWSLSGGRLTRVGCRRGRPGRQSSGPASRRFRKGGWLTYETTDDGETPAAAMSADAIADVVTTYARSLGWDLAPHDLRRTSATLACGGRAPLEPIQLALGHRSIQTTQRYLGSELDLADAACDRLGIRLDVPDRSHERESSAVNRQR